MRLSALLDSDARVVGGSRDVEIAGLSADSRHVAGGDLFAAISGTQADGHLFIPEALAKGAVALLGTRDVELYSSAVPVVVDANPRCALARMAARFYGSQPAFVAAITGTNGKTSIASFTRQLWDRAGMRAASLGTLGVQGRGNWVRGSLTTPDPVTLHRLCSELERAGVDHLAIEASSHGLDQFRLDGLKIAAAAFSNLSRDHFDYHGSADAYFAAKARLFGELVREGGTAVLNADVPEFEPLAKLARERGLDVVDYGRSARRYRLLEVVPETAGQLLTVEADGRRHRFHTSLVGGFQASNLLAALGLAVAGGATLETMLAALSSVRGAPGRMQLVGAHPCGAPAFVDYAHTPDALAKALEALRPHVSGRLYLVFGCGGNRDAGKREIMGRIAGELADRVYVTDDNPRHEPPELIRKAILAGLPGDKAQDIGDRAQAIRAAASALGAGDVLLVAGKGHEAGQIVGTTTHPFDDVEEVRRALAELEAGQ